jgi:hypothetical protein
MYQIAVAALLLAGETLAHTGHGVPAQHYHGWEYVLLAAAVAVAAAGWIMRRK